MSILFINAAWRDKSRTERLAREYFALYPEVDCTEIKLGDMASEVKPLNTDSLKVYNESVKKAAYDDRMFEFAKQFREFDEIVIAAPFWNFSIPALLHDYLELVLTQGLSFDMGPDGRYVSLCKARRLVFITTAGGHIPEDNHAFMYIKNLCDVFWNISDVEYYKAEGLDIYGADVEQLLSDTVAIMRKNV
ncbi:MAG: NAD(P)H-dependent oxidoreductase [Clostridia bacterium]|nr:NAD(P)H-dependent oxidoreductase [Clostridia bacterium]